MVTRKEDRLFNPNGRKHYRRRYSLTEVRIGIVLLLLMGLILAWVINKGRYPDPEIYASSPGTTGGAPTKVVDRGPVPKALTIDGFVEGELSSFDNSNLYEKIDGREGYYKSFGFERLHFVALAATADPAQTVDLEIYDLGDTKNALGAFAGEIPPGATPSMVAGGLEVLDRNALFMSRGRYYVKGVGADESAPVKAQLAFAAKQLRGGLEGEALPWSYSLFVEGLGLNPGKVSYQPENAFAFGFAKDVHVGLLDDDETEVFVVAQADDAQASELAKKFSEGFLGYGSEKSKADGVTWIADRYLDRISGVRAMGSYVVGVRSATDVAGATAAMKKLTAGVESLPKDASKLAAPTAPAAEEEPAYDPGAGNEGH